MGPRSPARRRSDEPRPCSPPPIPRRRPWRRKHQVRSRPGPLAGSPSRCCAPAMPDSDRACSASGPTRPPSCPSGLRRSTTAPTRSWTASSAWRAGARAVITRSRSWSSRPAPRRSTSGAFWWPTVRRGPQRRSTKPRWSVRSSTTTVSRRPGWRISSATGPSGSPVAKPSPVASGPRGGAIWPPAASAPAWPTRCVLCRQGTRTRSSPRSCATDSALATPWLWSTPTASPTPPIGVRFWPRPWTPCARRRPHPRSRRAQWLWSGAWSASPKPCAS